MQRRREAHLQNIVTWCMIRCFSSLVPLQELVLRMGGRPWEFYSPACDKITHVLAGQRGWGKGIREPAVVQHDAALAQERCPAD